MGLSLGSHSKDKAHRRPIDGPIAANRFLISRRFLAISFRPLPRPLVRRDWGAPLLVSRAPGWSHLDSSPGWPRRGRGRFIKINSFPTFGNILCPIQFRPVLLSPCLSADCFSGFLLRMYPGDPADLVGIGQTRRMVADVMVSGINVN